MQGYGGHLRFLWLLGCTAMVTTLRSHSRFVFLLLPLPPRLASAHLLPLALLVRLGGLPILPLRLPPRGGGEQARASFAGAGRAKLAAACSRDAASSSL